MARRIFIFTIVLLAAGYSQSQGATVFDHDAHLQEYVPDTPCAVCHEPGAATIVPDKAVCRECHDQELVDAAVLPATKTHGPVWALNHRLEAKVDDRACAACHQQDDCLECHKSGFADEMGAFGNNMINVHRSDFFVTHPIPARTDPQLCASCHENAFCLECHDDFRREELAGVSHRRAWSSITVGGTPHEQFSTSQCLSCHPDSVLPVHEWTTGHAREARKNIVTCQACHPEGDVCLTCHSARTGLRVNPHPADWGDIQERLNNASNGRTCRKCH